MEKEMTDAEKFYNILSNKLIWLTKYGEEVYLAAREDIRSAIQETQKAFDTDNALIQLEILEEEEPLLASLRFGTMVTIFRRDAVLDIMRKCGAGNELMNQMKRLNSIHVIRRDEMFEALRKDVVLDIVKKYCEKYNTGHSIS